MYYRRSMAAKRIFVLTISYFIVILAPVLGTYLHERSDARPTRQEGNDYVQLI